MCSYWYSMALKDLGITCPSSKSELFDFIEEVKQTLKIEETCQILTITIQ